MRVSCAKCLTAPRLHSEEPFPGLDEQHQKVLVIANKEMSEKKFRTTLEASRDFAEMPEADERGSKALHVTKDPPKREYNNTDVQKLNVEGGFCIRAHRIRRARRALCVTPRASQAREQGRCRRSSNMLALSQSASQPLRRW